MSFREVAKLVYSVPSDSVCVSGFSTCRDLVRMFFFLATTFTDPVEDLLLTGLDDFCSREAVELT